MPPIAPTDAASRSSAARRQDRPYPAMKTSRIDVSPKGATATVEIRRAAFYPAVRRLRAVVAKLEIDPRMTESSDTSDTPAKPQDYAGSRAELAALADDFTPVITELWPRLEDHKYRWELHSYGLAEGYDKLVVSDIIALLIEALKGIGVADNNLLGAHVKANSHNPTSPGAA
jgi:hypothetical protein